MVSFKLARSNAQWDLALSNGIVKTGLGFGVGVVASVILFRRASIHRLLCSNKLGRMWPVFTGIGFGMGQGYAEGNQLFNPLLVPGTKLVSSKKD
jgi:inner membrane organizing system protein 1